MQMAGEQRIAAPRQRVWEALNDPAVLQAAIPGCQSLEREGDDRFVATVEIKIGPIGARFKGAVTLTDLDPPGGYTLVGEGNAGIAGSARGSAKVRLADDAGGGTLVSYDVDAQVGGRLAQLGGPIIDATAKQLAGRFFAKLGEVIGEPAATGAEAGAAAIPLAETGAGAALAAHPGLAPAPPLPTVFPAAASPAGALWGWVAALVMALLTGFALGRISVYAWVFLMMVLLIVITAAAGFEAGRRLGGRR